MWLSGGQFTLLNYKPVQGWFTFVWAFSCRAGGNVNGIWVCWLPHSCSIRNYKSVCRRWQLRLVVHLFVDHYEWKTWLWGRRPWHPCQFKKNHSCCGEKNPCMLLLGAALGVRLHHKMLHTKYECNMKYVVKIGVNLLALKV